MDGHQRMKLPDHHWRNRITTPARKPVGPSFSSGVAGISPGSAGLDNVPEGEAREAVYGCLPMRRK